MLKIMHKWRHRTLKNMCFASERLHFCTFVASATKINKMASKWTSTWPRNPQKFMSEASQKRAGKSVKKWKPQISTQMRFWSKTCPKWPPKAVWLFWGWGSFWGIFFQDGSTTSPGEPQPPKLQFFKSFLIYFWELLLQFIRQWAKWFLPCSLPAQLKFTEVITSWKVQMSRVW